MAEAAGERQLLPRFVGGRALAKQEAEAPCDKVRAYRGSR